MNTWSKQDFNIPGFDYNPDYDKPQPRSSPGLQSSPIIYLLSLLSDLDAIAFGCLGDLPNDDPNDPAYQPDPSMPTHHAPPLSNVQKACKVLDLMKAMNDFSLCVLLKTLFTSQDPTLTNTSNKYVSSGWFLAIMDLWWAGAGGFCNQELCDWTMDKAAGICSREAGWLAEWASVGPYEEEAKFLHVSACNVTVQMVNDFQLANLMKLYAHVLPQLQKILDAVVAKKMNWRSLSMYKAETQLLWVIRSMLSFRLLNCIQGKTLITLALLNLWSHCLNYHAAMNSLIFWDNRVSKCLTQAFNMFGITSSSTCQSLAITALRRLW